MNAENRTTLIIPMYPSQSNPQLNPTTTTLLPQLNPTSTTTIATMKIDSLLVHLFITNIIIRYSSTVRIDAYRDRDVECGGHVWYERMLYRIHGTCTWYRSQKKKERERGRERASS